MICLAVELLLHTINKHLILFIFFTFTTIAQSNCFDYQSNAAILLLLFKSTWKDEDYGEFEAAREEATEEVGREEQQNEEDTATEASQVCDTEEVKQKFLKL